MSRAKDQDHKESIPPLAEQDIPNLVGTVQRGLGMQHVVTTFDAVPTVALTFAGLGLRDMEDTNYTVMVFVGAARTLTGVAAATLATTGFTVGAGPLANDRLEVVVIGRIKDFPPASAY